MIAQMINPKKERREMEQQQLSAGFQPVQDKDL